MKYLQFLAITFMALMMASLTTMAHDELGDTGNGNGSSSPPPPAIAYSVKKTSKMTNRHCAGHAKTALKKIGFGNIKAGNSFAVGSRNGYKATFVCSISSVQVVAIVSGRGFSQARIYAKQLTAKFVKH